MKMSTCNYITWIQLWCNVFVLKHAGASFRNNQKHDPTFDKLPKHFWHEISSPFTDMPDDEFDEEKEETTTHEPYPFFENETLTSNVTTQLGSNVYLHCRVNNLGKNTVSWYRGKGYDMDLLTFDHETYSRDLRYSLKFRAPNDWQLFIQYANERDEGRYVCQISSVPPITLTVLLEVVVPRIEIVDERGLETPEKFYKAGSTIELKCVITKVPQPPKIVLWKHGLRMLNYDTSRGGISVKTDLNSGGAISRLYIANANRHDSGNYTCSMTDIAQQQTVFVHILSGEYPAAMQHGHSERWTPVVALIITCIIASALIQR